MEVLPEEGIDFSWPAKKPADKKPSDNLSATVKEEEDYLTWTNDCGKLAQVCNLHAQSALID